MRYFTLEEANEVVREIRPIIKPLVDMARKFDELSERERMIFREQLDWLMRTSNEVGFIVRDLEVGLIDFPTLRNGELVFLCWQVDEPEVMYWHGPEGYVGRRPINELY